MANNCEIVLLKDTFSAESLNHRDGRETFLAKVAEVNSSTLTEQELRTYFRGIQLALGIFAQKIGGLECEVLELKKDQLAAEARMESLHLKAQLEIQQLRAEISEVRLSKDRMNHIVRVAKVLKGNAYAPYAVKSLVDGVMNNSGHTSNLLSSTKLPKDFESRLEFAQQNGFKWNQNNRKPSKPAKQLLLLEEWEDQFCLVEKLTLEQVLDKKYITSLGAGAVAGALMLLERELGSLLPERKSLSVFNCYQRAVKVYNEKSSAQTPCVFDLKSLVSGCFEGLDDKSIETLAKRLGSKELASAAQVVDGLKKVVSKSLLPSFIPYEEDSDTQRLYAIQSGKYDQHLGAFSRKYFLVS